MLGCSSSKAGDPNKKELAKKFQHAGKQIVSIRNNFLGFFKRTEINPSLWTELPLDLLGEIMARLYFSDQARFLAVCKHWLHANYQKQSAHSLPWILRCTFDQRFEFSKCALYSPWVGNQPAFDEISLENVFPKRKTFGLTTCMNGWLLCSKQNLNVYEFVLFSPLTNKLVKLPDFIHGSPFGPSIVTFSAPPNSPGSILFLMHDSGDSEITISTYCKGDKKWITAEFDRKVPCSFLSNAVYIDGVFYLVSVEGNLAAYHIADRRWMILADSKFPRELMIFGMDYAMLFTNGELLLMCLDMKVYHGSRFILKFDWCLGGWVRLRSLRDQALFIGSRHNSFSVQFPADNFKANKVYHLNYYGLDVYSLTDGKLHYREEDSESNFSFSAGVAIWIEPHDHFVRLPDAAWNFKPN